MRALLALPFLLLAFVPAAAAETELAPPPVDPFCLLGDFIPETPLYYILWSCTAGQLGVPEPIYFLTGCTMGFPATDIECEQPPEQVVDNAVQLVGDVVQCPFQPVIPETPLYYVVWGCTGGQLGIPEPIHHLTGCTMGFPITDLQCESFDPQDFVLRAVACLVEEPVPCVVWIVAEVEALLDPA